MDNTFEVATACNVSLKTGEYFLPEYPVPEGETFDSFLSSEAQKGLTKLLKNNQKTYIRNILKDLITSSSP